jgi:pimeloyl-ACP methyl ester carboxylesterase
MALRTHLDGAVFAEHVAGRAPRILALHGWGRDRHDLLPALDGREVVAVDLPGFGSSPEPPAVWGSAEYADAVAALAVELGGPPSLVVCHSFGGRVGAHLAAEHPELVSGIVFAGVPLFRLDATGRSPLAYRAVRTARRLHLVSEARLDRARQQYGSADYNASQGRMREVFVKLVNEDYREQLQSITCPVGFCWGADDTAAPADIARRAALLVANAVTVEIVDGVGHDVHRDAPVALSSVIDAVAAAS